MEVRTLYLFLVNASFSFIFKDIWPLRLTGGPVVKNLPANGGDMSLIPGPGRFHMPWSN